MLFRSVEDAFSATPRPSAAVVAEFGRRGGAEFGRRGVEGAGCGGKVRKGISTDTCNYERYPRLFLGTQNCISVGLHILCPIHPLSVGSCVRVLLSCG